MWFFSVSFNFEAKLAAKIHGGGESFGRKLYKLQQLKLLRHHHRCYANDVLIKKAKLNYGNTEFDLYMKLIDQPLVSYVALML